MEENTHGISIRDLSSVEEVKTQDLLMITRIGDNESYSSRKATVGQVSEQISSVVKDAVYPDLLSLSGQVKDLSGQYETILGKIDSQIEYLNRIV